MIQKLKMTLLSLGALFLFSAPLAFAGVASAIVTSDDIERGLCSGAQIDFGGTAPCPATSPGTANTIVAKVINILSLIVAAVAVIMIIFGGFRYVTSGGKQESVTSAKNTILYGLIGLVIVALAQIIVNFVLKTLVDATP